MNQQRSISGRCNSCGKKKEYKYLKLILDQCPAKRPE